MNTWAHTAKLARDNKPVKSSFIAIGTLINSSARPEQSYCLEAAMWQESAIARIVTRNGYAHKAIGMLVAKLHTGAINLAIAESVFQSALLLDSE